MLKTELENNIQIIEDVKNWEEAIKIASQPLLNNKKIQETYVEAMISNIHKTGPYIVIMPRVALPHSRPENGVNETCISLLKINQGVSFSKDKEDVNIIFVLGAKDNDSHIDLITQLTDLLEDENNINNIILAKDSSEILGVIDKLN